jgi:hypothetical protein
MPRNLDKNCSSRIPISGLDDSNNTSDVFLFRWPNPERQDNGKPVKYNSQLRIKLFGARFYDKT